MAVTHAPRPSMPKRIVLPSLAALALPRPSVSRTPSPSSSSSSSPTIAPHLLMTSHAQSPTPSLHRSPSSSPDLPLLSLPTPPSFPYTLPRISPSPPPHSLPRISKHARSHPHPYSSSSSPSSCSRSPLLSYGGSGAPQRLRFRLHPAASPAHADALVVRTRSRAVLFVGPRNVALVRARQAAGMMLANDGDEDAKVYYYKVVYALPEAQVGLAKMAMRGW